MRQKRVASQAPEPRYRLRLIRQVDPATSPKTSCIRHAIPAESCPPISEKNSHHLRVGPSFIRKFEIAPRYLNYGQGTFRALSALGAPYSNWLTHGSGESRLRHQPARCLEDRNRCSSVLISPPLASPHGIPLRSCPTSVAFVLLALAASYYPCSYKPPGPRPHPSRFRKLTRRSSCHPS
jgi:hypothetical protein